MFTLKRDTSQYGYPYEVWAKKQPIHHQEWEHLGRYFRIYNENDVYVGCVYWWKPERKWRLFAANIYDSIGHFDDRYKALLFLKLYLANKQKEN